MFTNFNLYMLLQQLMSAGVERKASTSSDNLFQLTKI